MDILLFIILLVFQGIANQVLSAGGGGGGVGKEGVRGEGVYIVLCSSLLSLVTYLPASSKFLYVLSRVKNNYCTLILIHY